MERLELDTVRASADASGNLTVFLQPRRDIPEFLEPVLSRQLTAQNLTGSGHVELGLPAIFKTPTVAALSEAIMTREMARTDDELLTALLAQLED